MKSVWTPLAVMILATVPVLACQPAAPRPVAPSHLHLVLRVPEDGAAEVLSAAAVPGAAVLSDAYNGELLWLVSRDGRGLAAGSVPDPFESRAFGVPGSTPEGHGRLGAGTIVVLVPGFDLDGPLDALAIDLYRLKPAPDGSAVSRVDPETVERLLQEGRLERVSSLSGRDLAVQIRRVGRTASP
jgi:hypothetical protein